MPHKSGHTDEAPGLIKVPCGNHAEHEKRVAEEKTKRAAKTAPPSNPNPPKP
ncbi:MAG TPA: hypothetical protein VHY30_01575 [Verrucomicrobiae bacterium]|jgi:hypothetical protein|nr:hypothetical protein [Verrucomicrobiae bacterium]